MLQQLKNDSKAYHDWLHHVVELNNKNKEEVPLELELFHHCPCMHKAVTHDSSGGVGNSDSETPNAGGLQSTADCG